MFFIFNIAKRNCLTQNFYKYFINYYYNNIIDIRELNLIFCHKFKVYMEIIII